MTFPRDILESQASPEPVINANNRTIGWAAVYGNDPLGTAGLTWAYFGGRWSGFDIDDDSLTLTASATNYLVVETATGILSASTTDTQWTDTAYQRVYKVTTGASTVTASEDHRAGARGVHGGSGSGGAASGLDDGDYGDIVASGGGTTLTIDSAVLSAFGRTLIDDADVATARATLGLGSAATQASSAFVAASAIGATNGVAALDSSGKVPAANLPSYVDDVLEFANLAAFPATGETGKIYVALDTNVQYRWSGSAYIQLVSSPGTTDAVAEGSTNQYFTAARVRAAVLTGLSTATNAAIAATDSVLVAFGKIQAQISALINADTVTALTISSGVVNIDCSLGRYFTLSLTANVTSVTFSNLPGSGKGASKWIEIVQDSNGGRTVAWPSSFKWAGGTAGAVSTAANAVDELAITTVSNGGTWKATLGKAWS